MQEPPVSTPSSIGRCVDAIVEREWNIGLLASALEQSEQLNRIYGGFPAYRYHRLGIAPSRLRTHPLATVWNQLAHKAHLPPLCRLNEPLSVGSWVARHSDLAPIVNCNGTAYRFLFPRIKHSGRTLVIERGSMYPCDFFLFQERAKREAGYPATDQLPASIVDEMEKTKLADFVVCGSEMIRQSYLQRGFPADRVIACHYGINQQKFAFQSREPAHGRALRIVSVGIVGLRKGIWRLIRLAEWAQSRGFNLSISLVGPVEPEAAELLAKTRAPIEFLGVRKGPELIEILHRADLYAMFSYEEGFPLALLEAMSTGLPAMVSNDTGAREAITDNMEGVILRDFNPTEFDAVLAPLFTQPARLIEMGMRARGVVEKAFTHAHYAARIGQAYQKIAATRLTHSV